ncbi:hypothetical protein [Staphylococcus succinus]|nr:hypothetical protein [Staphylococcus succinus]
MKIYEQNGNVHMVVETELEEQALRDNKEELESKFDEMVAEAIKKAQR